MKLKQHSLSFAVLALFSGHVAAQEAPLAIAKQIDEVNTRYARDWAEVQQQGDQLQDDAPEGYENAVQIDVDCKKKKQEIKLDIPEMSINRKDMSLDLPQVTMTARRVVWDNPETVMRSTICGYYPVFSGLKVKMKPLKCDLPQVRMVRREASTDVPEFKWNRTDLKLDIPAFQMKTQRWAFDLPDCKIDSLKAKTKDLEEQSERLQERATELAERQKAEIQTLVAQDLVARRGQVDTSFGEAIENLQAAITQVRTYGIDPTKVYQEGGPSLDLVAQLVELQSRRAAELAKIDASIAGLTG